MLDFRRLALLSNEELAHYDIVETHLASAVGMPGSEKIDQARCVKMIDDFVPWVRRYTEHCLAHPNPADDRGEPEAKTRMRCLIQVLWKGANIRYNLAKVPEDAPWGFQDSFIHGALYGDGGTCATLPILYTAVGRRLGYPLKLVTTWGAKWCHLFCRWDDPAGERFNVDANATGVGFQPDDYFREWLGMDRQREEMGRYLLSMTPREELAGFLMCRGNGWVHLGCRRPAVDAFAWASSLCPDNRVYVNTLKLRYNEWQGEICRRKPPGFPKFRLQVCRRRWPSELPLDLEGNIVCVETMDNVLNDQEMESRWWAPMRQGWQGLRTPREAFVDSWGDRIKVRYRF